MSRPVDRQFLIEFETSFFVYEGRTSSIGVCSLRIIYGKKKTVFLLSELVDNPGSSITNAIAEIWEQLQKKYPEQTKNHPLLIEHYDDRFIYSDVQGKNRYAEVTISEAAVKWTDKSPIEIAEIAEIEPSMLKIDPHILNTGTEILFEEVNNEKSHS
jgi:hypothetical protein